MVEFLCNTVTDPAVFWPALEAIATVVAAAIIIWQLKRLREETVAHRFEGFQYAMQLLAAPEFANQAGSLHKVLEQGDPHQFVSSLPPLVYWILRTLEIVAKLIRDGYLDEEFFFSVEGRRLAQLARRIRMIEEGKNTPRFEEENRLYPNGRHLLRRAEAWDDRHSSTN